MKTSTTLNLVQKPTININIQKMLQLLQFPTLELNQKISHIVEHNPLLDYDESNTNTHEQYNDNNYYNPKANIDNSTDDAQIAKETLHSHILAQIQLSKLSIKQQIITLIIIDYINDNGYITTPLTDILKTIHKHIGTNKCSLDEVKHVLTIIQKCDPTGVGARTLKECLLLQLQNMPQSVYIKKAIFIVKHYLHSLAEYNITNLVKKTKLASHELQKIISIIKSLDPKPGYKIVNNETYYLIPDIIVKKEKNDWIIKLNTNISPNLKINYDYINLISDKNLKDLKYTKHHLEEARWLMQTIKIRNQFLLKIANYIISVQKDFLENGELLLLKPLSITKIASDLNLSISTISRIVNQKYIFTPKGTFKLKYFISTAIKNNKTKSTNTIKILIKDILDNEKYTGKLTDLKIAEMLSQKGISIARRTVTKYRNILRTKELSSNKII